MIIDAINQTLRYTPLYPDFGYTMKLLQTSYSTALPDGSIPCSHSKIHLFIGHEAMKIRETAQPKAYLNTLISKPVTVMINNKA